MCSNVWSLLVTLLVMSSENFITFVIDSFCFSFFQCNVKKNFFHINTFKLTPVFFFSSSEFFHELQITYFAIIILESILFPLFQWYLSEIFFYYHPRSKIHSISRKLSKRSSIRISKTFSIRYWILHWSSGRSSNWRHKKKVTDETSFF